MQQLLSHEHPYSLVEWRRVSSLRTFSRLQDRAQAVRQLSPPRVVLHDRCLNTLLLGEVWVDVLGGECE